MNKLEPFRFTDFFMDFKTQSRVWFTSNPPLKGAVNSMEQKIRVFFYRTDIQECHVSVLDHNDLGIFANSCCRHLTYIEPIFGSAKSSQINSYL
jgi:hypothetical protein